MLLSSTAGHAKGKHVRPGYFAHKGDVEKVGGSDKIIWYDLKTSRGAANRARAIWPGGFTLYRFGNVYDESTYRKVST